MSNGEHSQAIGKLQGKLESHERHCEERESNTQAQFTGIYEKFDAMDKRFSLLERKMIIGYGVLTALVLGGDEAKQFLGWIL